ncbi:hypothetical protein IV102_21685 [bacterium]|nr:hypothetical protein [bacterium]
MKAMTLYSGSYPKWLHPCPVAEAFQRISQLLPILKKLEPDQLPSPLESRLLKEQFVNQVGNMASVGDAGHIRHLSRQALAAGLLCGALDGAHLYLVDQQPESFEFPPALAHFPQELCQIVEVADQYWRGLDLENLELQSSYGKQQNLQTDEENIAILGRSGISAREIQRQFSETFRTGYGIGLVEAALALIFGQ